MFNTPLNTYPHKVLCFLDDILDFLVISVKYTYSCYLNLYLYLE